MSILISLSVLEAPRPVMLNFVRFSRSKTIIAIRLKEQNRLMVKKVRITIQFNFRPILTIWYFEISQGL